MKVLQNYRSICFTTSGRNKSKEAPSRELEYQSSVNRCPERTTLYRARLIFGFEHLPPILGGPLRARKRFNYSRFVLLDLYELYLFNLYPACMYSLLDYIESLCGIATPLACLSLHKIYYSRFPFSTLLLVFDLGSGGG
jgi:hypothetical protein